MPLARLLWPTAPHAGLRLRPSDILAVPLLLFFLYQSGFAQTAADVSPGASRSLAGKVLYEKACARCHGNDGKGDRSDIQLDVPLPNFARCAEAAEEPDEQWRLIIEKGGVVYGMSPQMPAYGDALAREQIDSLLIYLREFCGNRRWVRGEMNFQRPLFTEKAYPENELVFAARVQRNKDRRASVAWINQLERRIGPRTQIEFVLPVQSVDGTQGIGDLEVGVKQVLFDSLPKRLLISAGVDVGFPTGQSERGLGSGTTKFEPFLALGKETRGWIVQGSCKVELPADARQAEREFAYSIAIGYPAIMIGGVRDVFPMIEIVGGRELKADALNHVSIVPQIRLPIDRMGRWAFALGPVFSVSQRAQSRVGFAAYLLYEYLGR